MHTRIKTIRSFFNLTREEFALQVQLGIIDIDNIEQGNVLIPDKLIHDICNIYQINEEWLRTGEGIMSNINRTSNHVYTDISNLKSILLRFIWSIDDKLLQDLIDEAAMSLSPTLGGISIDEVHKSLKISLYRQELEAEKKGATLLALHAILGKRIRGVRF